jgi:hypothetical protein
LQYSFAGRSDPHEEGHHLFATQITLRF